VSNTIAWSEDFDDYAAGHISAHEIRCVLCGLAPCNCPPFGTDEYFKLIDKLHGRNR
jgi:hypothetical protein